MANDLSFDVDEFMAMTPQERVGVCLKLAQRAQALAEAAQAPHQKHYLVIAEEWLTLAEDMQRAIPTKS